MQDVCLIIWNSHCWIEETTNLGSPNAKRDSDCITSSKFVNAYGEDHPEVKESRFSKVTEIVENALEALTFIRLPGELQPNEVLAHDKVELDEFLLMTRFCMIRGLPQVKKKYWDI